MRYVAIRWMAAYGGHNVPLDHALNWEWSNDQQAAAAVTRPHKAATWPTNPKVGLRVRPSAILRTYAEDTWTVPALNGKLRATRGEHGFFTNPERALEANEASPGVYHEYAEATVSHRKVGHERYDALVVKTTRLLRNREVIEAIAWARARGLKVLVYKNGRAEEVVNR